MCVCVCVKERMREKEKEEGELRKDVSAISSDRFFGPFIWSALRRLKHVIKRDSTTPPSVETIILYEQKK